MAESVYLVRAGDHLVSHCRCAPGLITAPPQQDCPWCGCGWLFTCIGCRQGFAFAQSVVVPYSLEELAAMDIHAMYGVKAKRKDIDVWVGLMRQLMGDDLEPGRLWVYLDGYLLPADANDTLEIEGIHSHHRLPWIPHIQALHDPSVLSNCLGSETYWRQTAVG